MKFIFFKTGKPRRFEYRPRYYDPEKEDAENRYKAYMSDDPSERIKAQIARRWRRRRHDSTKQKSQKLMVFVYLIILFFILYLIYNLPIF
ncbi:MAG: hypothetical protein K9I94_01585 [Bacteroidales bacterium]|nr:hypothetical protein [Bacteroidales bacterium]